MNEPHTCAVLAAIEALVVPQLDDAASRWYSTVKQKVRADFSELATAFPETPRRVKRAALLVPARDTKSALFGPNGGPVMNPWRREDAVRAALLLSFVEGGGNADDAVAPLYFHGDLGERISALRALQVLPVSGSALSAVRDALRSNVGTLFEAAICENEYASSHLPDELLFQAAVKCLFVGLRLDRISQLEQRATRELGRMLVAYATERRHAGRPVAPEIWPLVGIVQPEGAVALTEAYLRSATDPSERRFLELGMARLQGPRPDNTCDH